ncbi:DegV family protein with EDD domain [Herbinix hemicellulosilytica]|uniref:DegV domain-containing protein CPE0026 n=1 Tax=Herbinix hemicellulosilytica TaxID=1564487 RepID=A0A0H5SXB6_HERHM|nr:DegV family protein [Herbinix hemicellulosilytica]RBP58800.1 DegV family protein with EDD domain [Herbinix hemicellulosilytica]CRZ34993.1 DegV domain-containing protein CPE0026 [Herbinix hemicellulosilytica]
MRDFVITTDRTCDLPDNFIKKHNLKIIPLYYSFDGKIYGEEDDLDPKEFYDIMRAGKMPTTMAANPEAVRKIFSGLVNEGYDILHIAFSSALSGSCSVAETVARDICEEIPDAKITVIDSLCASMGEGLLVYKAVKMKEEGKSLDEIAKWLEDNKLNLCHIFTVDDLHHLRRGGRLSRTSAIVGTLIHVKPVLHVNNEGRLVPLNNVRGRKKALISLVEQMEKRLPGYEDKNDIVFISHGDCLEDAEYVASLIRERFGIENFLINYVCPTIGSHSGPGTVALFFMGNER